MTSNSFCFNLTKLASLKFGQNCVRLQVALKALIATTLILSVCTPVEARQPKRPNYTNKPATSQKKPQTKPKNTEPPQPAWKLFTAPDGRFTILMPGKPEMLTQTQKTHMGEIQLQLFVAKPANQEVAYVVTYNDFPYSYGQLAHPQLILSNARDLALKTTQSNLINQRDIDSSNGHPGRELEYINRGGKITKHRMYFVNGRLYQVMVMTTRNQQKTLDKTISGFLNSFQVALR